MTFAAAVLLHLAVLYAPRAPSTAGAPGLDKVVHLTIFALVVVTAARAGLPVRPVLAVLVAHAVVSEVVQATLLPGRAGDLLDAVADVAGVLLGWGSLVSAGRWRERGPAGPGSDVPEDGCAPGPR